MGSVATTGFTVANLLQSITSGTPQLSSALSSSAVQSALQNAPASDLVQLSDQALQLQVADQLFANSSTTASAADTATIPSSLNPLSSLLSSLNATTAAPSGSSGASASTASLSNQLAGYQSDLQSEEMQSLFGLSQSSPPLSTLFDVLG
jgi:hypothetical protein